MDDELDSRLERLDPDRRRLFEALAGDFAQEPRATWLAPAKEPERPSSLQERLWFLSQLDPESPVYNSAIEIPISGPLDVRALVAVTKQLVERHDLLRATFVESSDGRPSVQVVPRVEVDLPITDLARVAPAHREQYAAHVAEIYARLPFALGSPPLFRVSLTRMSETLHLLSFIAHHTICDRHSSDVVVSELAGLYAALVDGTTPPSPPAVRFSDYAEWQRSCLVDEDLNRYWTTVLSGRAAATELQPDRARPAAQSFRGAASDMQFSYELSETLRSTAQRERVTLFSLFCTIIAVVLRAYTDERDLVVGTSVSGRDAAELDDVVGPFVNLVALRFAFPPEAGTRSFLASVSQTVASALDHRGLPVEQLLHVLWPRRDMSKNPFFQILIEFDAVAPVTVTAGEVTFGPAREIDTGTSPFDVSLAIHDRPTISIACRYSTDLFEERTIAQFLANIRSVAEAIVDALDYPIDALLQSVSISKCAPPTHHNQPDRVPERSRRHEPPQRILEVLATLCGELLKLSAIDADDNFFELGGDSLTTMQLVARARSAGIVITPRDVFLQQTIGGISVVARDLGSVDASGSDQSENAFGWTKSELEEIAAAIDDVVAESQ